MVITNVMMIDIITIITEAEDIIGKITNIIKITKITITTDVMKEIDIADKG